MVYLGFFSWGFLISVIEVEVCFWNLLYILYMYFFFFFDIRGLLIMFDFISYLVEEYYISDVFFFLEVKNRIVIDWELEYIKGCVRLC